MKTQKPLVAIHCLVYNHEPYLRDCLDGFVSQQTTFPFIAVVQDDASTDNSAAILKEYAEKYPEIIKPIYHTENMYSKGLVEQDINTAIQSTGCKYIALCEGDDYWIDPLKLQKQVDILEADESLIAVFTNYCTVDAKGKIIREQSSYDANPSARYTLRDFFKYTPVYPTASVLYRNIHREEKEAMYEHTKNPFLGDWTLWIILHLFGDFYYLDEVTTAYRVNPTSVSHTVNRVERAKATWTICASVADIIPPEYNDIISHLRDRSWNYINVAHAYRKEHKYFQAMYYLILSTINAPRITWNYFLKFFI